MKPGIAARKAALDAVNDIKAHRRMLSEHQFSGKLKPDELARAQSLAASCFRFSGRADRFLENFLTSPPPEEVIAILRLAAIEHFVDHLPPHAVVDAAVELVKLDLTTERFSGLVNAVTRKVVASVQGDWDRLKPQTLPPWLRKQLRQTYGKGTVVAIEASHERGSPTDLTVKDGSTAEPLAKSLGATLLPTGSLRLSSQQGQISALPGYNTGDWWVQDAAAAVPVKLLGDLRGKSALDLCAAPGGKTLQMAASGASVTAVDLSERRMERLRQNLDRTGLQAGIVVADALSFDPGRQFDAILLDAPCSATGTIRRHPELPLIRTEEEIAQLMSLQQKMLNRAARLLAPGGKLVYCTCSLLPQEGEAQIEAFLASSPPFRLAEINASALGLNPDWMGPFGLRLRPDFWKESAGMDGFFAALLQRD